MIELKDMSNVTEIPFLSFEESRNRYWGVSDRDVPILIGAAAGKKYHKIDIHTNLDRSQVSVNQML